MINRPYLNETRWKKDEDDSRHRPQSATCTHARTHIHAHSSHTRGRGAVKIKRNEFFSTHLIPHFILFCELSFSVSHAILACCGLNVKGPCQGLAQNVSPPARGIVYGGCGAFKGWDLDGGGGTEAGL